MDPVEKMDEDVKDIVRRKSFRMHGSAKGANITVNKDGTWLRRASR